MLEWVLRTDLLTKGTDYEITTLFLALPGRLK
jgi:hypothetical protein